MFDTRRVGEKGEEGWKKGGGGGCCKVCVSVIYRAWEGDITCNLRQFHPYKQTERERERACKSEGRRCTLELTESEHARQRNRARESEKMYNWGGKKEH